MDAELAAAMAVALGALAAASPASAAIFRVDDDRGQCPSAPYTLDPGRDRRRRARGHGHGLPRQLHRRQRRARQNALTISKSLTLKGAGADLVSIKPRRGRADHRGRRRTSATASATSSLSSAIQALPITVDISGVTIDGNGAVVEAGVVYLDAKGAFFRNRVTNVVTSELAADQDKPGAYRGPQFGYGIAQVTANTSAPAIAGGPRADRQPVADRPLQPHRRPDRRCDQRRRAVRALRRLEPRRDLQQLDRRPPAVHELRRRRQLHRERLTRQQPDHDRARCSARTASA